MLLLVAAVLLRRWPMPAALAALAAVATLGLSGLAATAEPRWLASRRSRFTQASPPSGPARSCLCMRASGACAAPCPALQPSCSRAAC
jgi:hypothetical protein